MSFEKSKTPKKSGVNGPTFCVNVQAVTELIEILEKSGVTEIEYGHGDVFIRIAKSNKVIKEISSAQATVSEIDHVTKDVITKNETSKDLTNINIISSPMVGTVYLAAKAGAEPFVKVGDYVQKDQVVLIIEAMKVMNPIKTSFTGRVTKILVENATPVEYGEDLLHIDSSS